MCGTRNSMIKLRTAPNGRGCSSSCPEDSQFSSIALRV